MDDPRRSLYTPSGESNAGVHDEGRPGCLRRWLDLIHILPPTLPSRLHDVVV